MYARHVITIELTSVGLTHTCPIYFCLSSDSLPIKCNVRNPYRAKNYVCIISAGLDPVCK